MRSTKSTARLSLVAAGFLGASVLASSLPASPALAHQHAEPPNDATAVYSAHLSKWLAGAQIHFYEQPLTYASPSPEDRDLAAYLLLPAAGQRSAQRILLDTYGPEGTSAEVGSVALKKRRDKRAWELVVQVAWHNRHASLSQKCTYVLPTAKAGKITVPQKGLPGRCTPTSAD